jgi:transcription elongation factor Elf1
MSEEFPIKEEHYEQLINDFRSIRFPCIICGSRDIEIIEAEPHDRINAHSHSHIRDIELTTAFYVTGILFCRKCKHRFHIKILDQGIRNTDVYFDNALT